MFEEENPYNVEKLNQLRTQMLIGDVNSAADDGSRKGSARFCELMSLKDIMAKEIGDETRHDKVETYI